VCGGKDFPKSQVLSSERKTDRVREDESGDSENGEDNELPCGLSFLFTKSLPSV